MRPLPQVLPAQPHLLGGIPPASYAYKFTVANSTPSITADLYCELDHRQSVRFCADALCWDTYYNPYEEEVFTCGVVRMYMCLLQFKLGDE